MPAKKEGFKILVIEDNLGDFVLIEEFLQEKIKTLILVHAKTYKEARHILLNDNYFDIILLDLSLPDRTGMPLIKEIIELCSTTPVIVLTGYSDFEFGIQSLSLGISDYILKEELTGVVLYKSIVYSIERKKIILDLEDSERKYSELFHLSPQPMWVFDIDSLFFLNVNEAAIKHYGYTREEFLLMTIKDIRPVSEIKKMEKALKTFDNEGQLTYKGQFINKKKNGKLIQVDTQSNIIKYKGRNAVVVLAIDVTERMDYINEIEQQNKRLKEISWIQSHVVRAPLARLMGLINIVKEMTDDNEEKQKTCAYILSSANELDKVIKQITDKTSMPFENYKF